MTAIGTAPSRIVRSGGFRRPVGLLSVVNLLVKELRESAGVVIAGLAIFWALPALLDVLYALIDPGEKIRCGGCWVMIIGFGWLYAAIVGAHTVCRDWGRQEERFLTAQPVGRRSIIVAKLLAGILAVGLVLAVAGLWDLVWYEVCRNAPQTASVVPVREMNLPKSAAIVVACVIGCAYMLAFTAAVVTRQMLASVLLSSLVLLIWGVAPLLSNRLVSIHPGWDLAVSEGAALGSVFSTAVGLVIAGCALGSLAAATRERSVRVGFKQLAWLVAVVVIGLFVMAMGEVGNSLRVCDQMVVGRKEAWLEQPTWGLTVAQRGNRFYAGLIPSPVTRVGFAAVQFDVDGAGRIVDQRVVSFPFAAGTAVDECQDARLMLRGVSLEEIRSEPGCGDLVAFGTANYSSGRVGREAGATATASSADAPTSSRSRRRSEYYRLTTYWRTRYTMQDANRMEPVRHDEISISAGQGLGISSGRGYAYTDDRLFILRLGEVSVVDAGGNYDSSARVNAPRHLQVFDWADGVEAKPRYHFRLPSFVDRLRLRGRSLELLDGWRGTCVARLDADHPETWAEAGDTTSQPARIKLDRTLSAMLPATERFLGGEPSLMGGGEAAYVFDNRGVRVFERPTVRTSDLHLLGSYMRSPLSMALFNRFTSPPLMVGRDLILQVGASSDGSGYVGILYDVADPRHPRRVGFHRQASGSVMRPVEDYDDFIRFTEGYLVCFNPTTSENSDWRVTVLAKP
ncbi:MAG: hypothetical protein JXQ73_02155 [Phycisphaerae bacterium]|nr:hypothetical protein [Phycisphaerae bacterium]